jgi:hypothetical protein
MALKRHTLRAALLLVAAMREELRRQRRLDCLAQWKNLQAPAFPHPDCVPGCVDE